MPQRPWVLLSRGLEVYRQLASRAAGLVDAFRFLWHSLDHLINAVELLIGQGVQSFEGLTVRPVRLRVIQHLFLGCREICALECFGGSNVIAFSHLRPPSWLGQLRSATVLRPRRQLLHR